MYRIPFDVFCHVLRPKLNASTVIAFEQSTLYHRGLVHVTRQKRRLKHGYINELVYSRIREKQQPYYRLKLMLEDAKSTIKFSDVKMFWTETINNESDQPQGLEVLNGGPIVPYILVKCNLHERKGIKYLYAPTSMLGHSTFYIHGSRRTGTTTIAKCLVSTYSNRTILLCSDFCIEVDDWKRDITSKLSGLFPVSLGLLYNSLQGNKYQKSGLVVVFDNILEETARTKRIKIMEIFKMLRDLDAVIIVTSQLNANEEGNFRSAIRSNDMAYVSLRMSWFVNVAGNGDDLHHNNRYPAMYEEHSSPCY
uniref:P-loop-containing nucleoside triphosphate hydrolase n=1 Tax=Clandestinovirus TaxID=2831644 RepID=A0A8F8KTV9_9VIRU|nr:P-loop-containing nucleoside triphosphate hydrolase [Clandestinovirus]